MTDSLRYLDGAWLPDSTAWDHLTDEERWVIAPKLVAPGDRGHIAESNPLVAGQLFNTRFTAANPEHTLAIVTGVRNFIDNSGGHCDSEVWQQIIVLEHGWSGKNNSAGFAFHVENKSTFLKTLVRNGYDVDRWYERFNTLNNHKHSARFVTETSYETSMHLIQQPGYPVTRFDVHWDPRSSAFRTWDSLKYPNIGKRPFFLPGRIREQIAAGLSHKNPQSSAQTREALRRMGIVPAIETQPAIDEVPA